MLAYAGFASLTMGISATRKSNENGRTFPFSVIGLAVGTLSSTRSSFGVVVKKNRDANPTTTTTRSLALFLVMVYSFMIYMQKNLVTLSIVHNIFLTRDQRYSLNQGNRLLITGVSLPVWFFKGDTSEPAEEVFCKYILLNQKDKPTSITETKRGYKINLPQVPESYQLPSLTNDEWRLMSEKQKSDWYTKTRKPIGGWKLLDYVDGGSKGLHFKISENKNLSKKTGNDLLEKTNVVHLIIIRDYDELESSLTC